MATEIDSSQKIPIKIVDFDAILCGTPVGDASLRELAELIHCSSGKSLILADIHRQDRGIILQGDNCEMDVTKMIRESKPENATAEQTLSIK